MSDTIRVQGDGHILHIQINRPEKKNALTQAMYAEMADGLARAETEPGVRVVVLSGTESVFSAGNDISDFLTAFSMDAQSPVVRFLTTLAHFPKAVVAAVNGPAMGIGTTMLLHCDLVYSGRGARYQLPFVNLGLVPEAASSLILPATLGHRRAAALLMLGDPFDAETALGLGIVNGVVEDEAVMETALRAATALAEKPPAALRLTKSLMRQWQMEGVERALAVESGLFAQQLRGPEAQEALSAFMERRKPNFLTFA
jgi:enoyl-CoA hydratase/carnithine racemase